MIGPVNWAKVFLAFRREKSYSCLKVFADFTDISLDQQVNPQFMPLA